MRLGKMLVCVTALAALSVGCSSEDGKAKAAEGSTDTKANEAVKAKGAAGATSSTELAPLVEAYARWLPGDSLVVGVVDVDSAFSMVSGMYGIDSSSTNPEVTKHQAAMRADLAELSRARLGMDVTKAETILFGVGIMGPSIVVLGVEVSATDTEEVDGVKAFKVLPRHPADAKELGQLPYTPWAMALPDGKGVVLFPSKERLSGLAALDSVSLAKSNRKEGYLELLAGMKGSFGLVGDLAFAVNAADLARDGKPGIREELGFEPPKLIAATFGSSLTVRMKGDAAELDKLDAKRKELIDQAIAEIEPQYAKRADENAFVAVSSITGLHGMRGLGAMLELERAGELSTYTIEGFQLGGGMAAVGVAAAIAVPAFLRYVKRSKASEAEIMTTKIANSLVLQYSTACAWPGEATTGSIPSGGEKQKIAFDGPVCEKLNMSASGGEHYFQYEVAKDVSGVADYLVTARADFEPGGPIYTFESRVSASKVKGECMASATPVTTTNEFE